MWPVLGSCTPGPGTRTTTSVDPDDRVDDRVNVGTHGLAPVRSDAFARLVSAWWWGWVEDRRVVSRQSQGRLRPRARIMQTLGEELISNEQVALIELVKNSYDADATNVVIRFAGAFEQDNGTIEVWDNGHGMSAKTVEHSWMEISTPHRHRSPRSESNRRRVLGAKGIGRFAAARLGYRTEVVTRRVNAEEIALAIDWSTFDNDDAYLDDIPIIWERRDPIIFTPGGEAADVLSIPVEAAGGTTAVPIFDHGTLVRSVRLRHAWTRDDLNKVRRALSRLIPRLRLKNLTYLRSPSSRYGSISLNRTPVWLGRWQPAKHWRIPTTRSLG